MGASHLLAAALPQTLQLPSCNQDILHKSFSLSLGKMSILVKIKHYYKNTFHYPPSCSVLADVSYIFHVKDINFRY